MLTKYFPLPLTWQTRAERPGTLDYTHLNKVLHSPTAIELSTLNELGAAVYFSVNKTDGNGRKKGNITHLRALWIDWDHGHPDIETLALKPTVAVQSSPGKLQAYWIFETPLPVEGNADRWQSAETALVTKFAGDARADKLNQVLRAPGYVNNKYDPPPLASVVYESGNLYTLEQVIEAFQLELLPVREPVLALAVPEENLPDDAARKARFTRWLARVPPPAEGGGERNQWYFKALAYGIKDCAVTDTEFLVDTLAAHSAKHHRDPYDHDELRRLAANAAKHGSHQVGQAVSMPNLILDDMPIPSSPPSSPLPEGVSSLAVARHEAAQAVADKEDTKKAAKHATLVALVARAYETAQHLFRAVQDEAGNRYLARVSELGILAPCDKDELKDLLTLKYDSVESASSIARDIVPSVKARIREQNVVQWKDIAPFVFKSAPTTSWAWNRLPFDPDPTAKCPPEFAEILARTSEQGARAIVLFFGSLLDLECERIQYLHLQGEGNDGKSTLMGLLNEVFGRRFVVTMRADDFKDSHSTSVLEQARLVMFHDENDSNFMSSGKFKMLTGDSNVTINPKGMARRTIKLNCRVLIASNNKPNLRGSLADVRRVLPVYLQSYSGGSDPKFVERLMAARYQVMQYCYAEWLKFAAQGHTEIPRPAEAEADILENSTQAAADDVIQDIFDMSDKDACELSPRQVNNIIRDTCKTTSVLYEAKSLIRSKFKIVRVNKQGGTDPRGRRVIRGLRLRKDAVA